MAAGEVRSGVLVPLGELTWSEFTARISVTAAWWAGLDGWHHGDSTLPEVAPLATHLWVDGTADGDPVLARVRIDGDTVVGCALFEGDGHLLDDGAVQVGFRVGDAELWGTDRRIAGAVQATYERATTIAAVQLVHPSVVLHLAEGTTAPWR